MYLSYHNFISVRINFAFYTSLKASPWEQRKLGDVVKRESVTQVSSTEYPAIEYEDVIPETGQLNKDIYKKGVQKAGILFDANKVLYGKLRPYLHNWVAPMYKGVAVGDWWVLNPCGLDRGFLYTLIQTVKFDTIANQSTGSKMPRADWKLLSTTEFSIPSLDEQIKIGKLVEGLNDYITLHQRKLEKLQATKKALLYELFPIENSRRPKRRFKGFTDDWEQRKLGEIASINPRTELPNSFKYVDLESVIGTNLIGCKKIEKENAPSRAQRLASFGDIFYQTVRPYQRNNYLFEKDDDDVVFSTGYAQLRSELDSYFLFTLIQTDSFVRKVLDNCTGTSYPAINSSELGKILISVPQDKLESHQIGTVFRILDNVITLHQRKLEKLKNLKAAYLNEMFV